MKRVFFIILFALWTNTCHAFDLDCNRWKISASSQDSVAVFYDNQTIVLRKGLNPPQIKVWLCFATLVSAHIPCSTVL